MCGNYSRAETIWGNTLILCFSFQIRVYNLNLRKENISQGLPLFFQKVGGAIAPPVPLFWRLCIIHYHFSNCSCFWTKHAIFLTCKLHMNVPGPGVLIMIQVSWKLLWGVPILQKQNWNFNFNVREENILERNGLSTK